MIYTGRFQDEEPEEEMQDENEGAIVWDAADEDGDRRYDAMVENRILAERHGWPENEDRFLMGIAGQESEIEYRRRVA